MCRRPSRSLNMTVTALMRFSSVRYFKRSSRTVSRGVRFSRAFFASRFNSSSSAYESVRKSCNPLKTQPPQNLGPKHQLSVVDGGRGNEFAIDCVYGEDQGI